MSLYKRGRIYWSRIVRAGEVFSRSTKCKNLTDARRVEAGWLILAEEGNVALRRPAKLILAHFEQRFFDYINTHVSAEKTRAYYKTHWIPLRESSLGAKWMQNITAADIVQWSQERSTKVGPASVNGSLRTLRRALRMAQEWGVVKTVPKIRTVKGERSREFVIDDDLLSKMLEHEKCTPLLRALLPFLIDTGLRLGEALSLPWSAVSDGSIFVECGKTKNARRTVPLTSRAKVILDELKKNKKSSPFPASPFTVSHQFRKLRTEMKLPDDCVIHSCRHTFCTRLGKKGVSAFQIMRLAGHASVQISQRYVQEDMDALKGAIKMLDEGEA